MLKPVSAFVYVFQDASTSVADACVALTAGVEEGDCGFSANELHAANTMTKIRNIDRFFILILLKKCLWTKPPNLRTLSVVGFCFLFISILLLFGSPSAACWNCPQFTRLRVDNIVIR